MTSEQEPIQLMDVTNGFISINLEALRRILTRDEIKDRRVCTISVTGAFRQGKSFLLNFLLRYLKLRYSEKRSITKDWLKEEDGPLQGFAFSSGSKRMTTGINLWPDIFLTQRGKGEKIAILLFDSQGSFDNKSTMDECANIFAFSTLISSVQIYNLMRNIQQNNLRHLQCFGGYGKLFANTNVPFQNICFLIRDWFSPDEHPYGDGKTLLSDFIDEATPQVKCEIENVKSLFETMNCFLLPYPGKAVATSNLFKGDLNEIDEDFKIHVQNFVDKLLCPSGLVLKTINGEKITAGQLICYIDEYCKVLESGDVPRVQSMFEATAAVHCKLMADKAFDSYVKNMERDVKNNSAILTRTSVFNIHRATKTNAIEQFNRCAKKFNDDTVSEKHLEKLIQDIDERYQDYEHLMRARRIKEAERLRQIQHDQEIRKRIEQKRAEAIRKNNTGSNSSDLATAFGNMSTDSKIGIAAAATGVAAALAFGIGKFLSSRNNNN